VSGRASWVLCPTDGKAHLLAVEGAHGVVLTTQCGRSLPSEILQHDRLPSRQLCPECVAAYLLLAPVFARMTPAGRRSSAPVRSPGGQPVPHHPSGDPSVWLARAAAAALGTVPGGSAPAPAGPGGGCGCGDRGSRARGLWAADPPLGVDDRGPSGGALSWLYGCGDRVVSALRAQRYDRWRDVDGTHVLVGARVEQVEGRVA
jgi:hypothetical protein